MPVKKSTTKKVTNHKTQAHKPASHTTHKATKKSADLESFHFIDKCVSTLQKKLKFIDTIMNSDALKSFLNTKIILDSNKRVKSNLESISQVLGRLAVVFGGIAVLMSLGAMGRLFRYFGGGYTILFILNLAYIIIGMVLGYGLIKMKKRVPFFVTFTVLVDVAYLIIASIFWGARAVSSPRSIIFYAVFMIYILKNKSLFNK